MSGQVETQPGARWCILTTSGGRTIPLAESLASAGFDVWTPTEVIRRKVRRGHSTVTVEKAAPIAPTLVFGKEEHLSDFARIVHQPFHRHPGFSIFQWCGKAPIIGDASLLGLRLREAEAQAAIEAVREGIARRERQMERASQMRTEQQRRKALRSERREFEKGARVVVPSEASMTGLTGTVIESNGTSALVAFGGSLVMTIEAWQILPIDVEAGQSTAS
jgi:hypothetical protein